MFEDRPRAKLNLTLKVVGRRDDGFHELRSIFLRIGLADRLTIDVGGADGSDRLTVSGLAGVSSHNNLVTQALDAVRARAEIPLPTLDVTLDKQIPAAAGMGGGSSDCASAIRLAQAVWGVGLSESEEMDLGAQPWIGRAVLPERINAWRWWRAAASASRRSPGTARRAS